MSEHNTDKVHLKELMRDADSRRNVALNYGDSCATWTLEIIKQIRAGKTPDATVLQTAEDYAKGFFLSYYGRTK